MFYCVMLRLKKQLNQQLFQTCTSCHRSLSYCDVLESGRLKELFRSLRNRYDVVLIDAPPVGISDSSILASAQMAQLWLYSIVNIRVIWRLNQTFAGFNWGKNIRRYSE